MSALPDASVRYFITQRDYALDLRPGDVVIYTPESDLYSVHRRVQGDRAEIEAALARCAPTLGSRTLQLVR